MLATECRRRRRFIARSRTNHMPPLGNAAGTEMPRYTHLPPTYRPGIIYCLSYRLLFAMHRAMLVQFCRHTTRRGIERQCRQQERGGENEA